MAHLSAVDFPFEGLATAWVVLFTVAFAVIVAMAFWTGLLFVRAARWRRNPPDAPAGAIDAFTWVFLVPALNEEVTIADSVDRLLGIGLARRRIVVIDDGSDDATPNVLARIGHPDLRVLRREPPHARQGKAAALNEAYRRIGEWIGDAERASVIVVVVDADGQLDPEAPRYAAAHLADPLVGGVQSLVRIYNRRRPLTWLQDVEFSVYGCLFQAGRNTWGTAGMGGNGQFNRLSALDDVADEHGPWRDRLTEDQDLGLRLIAARWFGRQELRAVVSQQGLSNPRRLFRQRTRWSQGNLQAMGLAGSIWRARLPTVPRVELLVYLLMPLWQTIIGVALVAAIVLAVLGEAPFWDEDHPAQIAFFYLLGFGGTMLGCLAGRSTVGSGGWLSALLVAHVYAFYSWMIWPVLLRSAARQLTFQSGWTKTEREPLTAGQP